MQFTRSWFKYIFCTSIHLYNYIICKHIHFVHSRSFRSAQWRSSSLYGDTGTTTRDYYLLPRDTLQCTRTWNRNCYIRLFRNRSILMTMHSFLLSDKVVKVEILIHFADTVKTHSLYKKMCIKTHSLYQIFNGYPASLISSKILIHIDVKEKRF